MSAGGARPGRLAPGDVERVERAVARVAGHATPRLSVRALSVRAGKATVRVRADRDTASAPTLDVVVRLFEPGTLPASRGRLLAAVDDEGVAPAVRLVDRALGTTVHDWVEGRSFSERDARDPARSSGLARTLRRLHAVDADVEPYDLAGWLDVYDARAQRAPASLTPERDAVRRAVDALRPRVARFVDGIETASLVHADVVPDNVIVRSSGDPVLVDWEYGGRFDPRFDVATVSELCGLGTAARERFVHAYFDGVPSAADVRRLDDAREIVRRLCEVWGRTELLDRPGDARARAWLDRLRRHD